MYFISFHFICSTSGQTETDFQLHVFHFISSHLQHKRHRRNSISFHFISSAAQAVQTELNFQLHALSFHFISFRMQFLVSRQSAAYKRAAFRVLREHRHKFRSHVAMTAMDFPTTSRIRTSDRRFQFSPRVIETGRVEAGGTFLVK
jgi:hypothetical protein